MHLPHLLDLIQVYNEAALVRVVFLDALSTKYSQMVGAIEMLNSLIMLVTKEAFNYTVIFEINIF